MEEVCNMEGFGGVMIKGRKRNVPGMLPQNEKTMPGLNGLTMTGMASFGCAPNET